MLNNNYSIDIRRKDWQTPGFVNDLLKWSDRWPHFAPAELACKHCGDLRINYEALDSLEYLRSQLWKSPLKIQSAYRCPIHNKNVRGAQGSLHMQGRAFDIWCQPWPGKVLTSFIWLAGQVPGKKFRGFGLYPNFIHIDTGPHRTWEQGDTKLDPEDRNDPEELE